MMWRAPRCLSRAAAALLLTVTALLIGCGKASVLTPIDANAFRADTLEILQTRFALTGTIRTQMTIDIEQQGRSSEARAILYYRRPGDLRIDILDPLNAPVAVLRAAGGEFSMVDVRHGEAIRAPLTDALLKRLYGMDLRVSDVRSAIVANPFAVGDTTRLKVGVAGDRTVVTRPSERIGHTEEIVIGLVSGEPVVRDWWVRDRDGRTVQHTTFDDYRDIGGILRPMTATVARPRDGVRLSFHATNPELNLDIPAQSFQHAFPPGIEVKRWDENGQPVDPARASED
jgi:outer membrane lipoprotein-sorting protein